MQQQATTPTPARQATPLHKRFLAKLVVDILPAMFVSVLGGFIMTQYQFNRAAPSHPASEQVVPASAEMMQLVRDEHTMIIDYLRTQMAAEQKRHAAEDAASADARAAADVAEAEQVAVPLPRPAAPAAVIAAKPLPRAKVIATASVATAPVAPIVPVVPPRAPFAVAQNDQPATAAPAAEPAPQPKSILTRTLEVKDHVVGATLHAVSMIGGIPSWIASVGDRIGGGSGETSSSTGRMFTTSM
jgi:hypothetical protein